MDGELRPAGVLALMAWSSLFVESWLLLLGKVPPDWLSFAFWAFFLLIAILASSVAFTWERTKR